MKAYIVGNPLVKEDSLPIVLLPKLRKALPDIAFEEADPNENFVPEEGSIIIDTVQGIKEVTLFETLDVFEQTTSVSPHDYDLLLHLQLLKKLHKITSVHILGVPARGDKQMVLKELSLVLLRWVRANRDFQV
jgi:Ni,Fe-hydrogenase maturation factor